VINPWKHPIDRTTPQHIIESRTLYIQWRKEVLARQPADWPYRQATIAEIQDLSLIYNPEPTRQDTYK